MCGVNETHEYKCVAYAGYFEKTLKRYIDEALTKHNPNYDRKAVAASASKPSESTEPKLFKWRDGSYHVLPEGYILTCRGDPKKEGEELNYARTAVQAYMSWNLPNLRTGICAIRNCDGDDFSISNQRKRFSDWGRLVKLWHHFILQSGKRIMDGRDTGNETKWQRQFQTGLQVYVSLLKFFHPSRVKRKRIRSNSSIVMAYKVSTVLKDLLTLKNILWKMKCLFALLKVAGFVRHYCFWVKVGPRKWKPKFPRKNRNTPEGKFTIRGWLQDVEDVKAWRKSLAEESDDDELVGLEPEESEEHAAEEPEEAEE